MTNGKLTTAAYISTMILIGSLCIGACSEPATEVSHSSTTTQTNVPSSSVTTQKTSSTQTNSN